MMVGTVLMVGAAAIVATACASSMDHPKMTAAESIEARKKLMKEQGAAWKNVQDKAKAGQVAAIVPDAEKLAATAKEIPALFPEGSLNPEKSAAKPEIWQKRAEFDEKAKNLETWANKLAAAAKANDTAQTQAIVKDFGRMACGSCHQPFRVPPKQ
jgi:cytochrome c556